MMSCFFVCLFWCLLDMIVLNGHSMEKRRFFNNSFVFHRRRRKRKTAYGFGTKWGWVNDNRISFWLSYPFKLWGERSHLALMRYWATLMLAGEPVMVTWRTAEPSVAPAILIWAPDIWRISLILLPCLPMMQPMSWETERQTGEGQTTSGH